MTARAMPTRCCSPADSSSGKGALAAEQAHLVERRAHALVHLAPRHAADRERQRDVVVDRPVVEQPVVLEHEADLAAECGNRAAAQLRGVPAVHDHLAARRALEQRDQPQHRALAGAGVAGQEGHLAGLELEGKLGEGFAPVRVTLEDAVESDHGVSAAAGRSSPST